MPFYVELPADEYGNTALPRAVVRATWHEHGDPHDSRLGGTRPYMICTAPPEIAGTHKGWYADGFGGWQKTEGPARMLTMEEWRELIKTGPYDPPLRMQVLESLRLHRSTIAASAFEIAADIGKVPGTMPPRRDPGRPQPHAAEVTWELREAMRDSLVERNYYAGHERWSLTAYGREQMSRGPATP